jgi:hypothetical protein
MLTPAERKDLKKWALALIQLIDASAPDQAVRLITAKVSQIISIERIRTKSEALAKINRSSAA